MKHNSAMLLRQTLGIFLMALMLVISLFTSPITESNAKQISTVYSQYEISAPSAVSDLDFLQVNSLKSNFVKIPVFSKIAEKFAEKTQIIFNETHFIPYPSLLKINSFSRNVFYVFISIKAP
ncbi:hypothetical protein [Marivirga sp.]|uniref:hypothetical protein n=1 Tax=Marivirga sp. TaxID=2018662 RepID=UPI002D7FD4CE|nr:hypothetical protein [Marivirga sp.]HET8860882.1 hypothetical protein [Marivirga sp.]